MVIKLRLWYGRIAHDFIRRRWLKLRVYLWKRKFDRDFSSWMKTLPGETQGEKLRGINGN